LPADGLDLNGQIAQAFSVISLPLAVAAAYLAAIWPLINELMEDDPVGSSDYEKRLRRRKRTSFSAAAAVLTVFELSIALVLVPLAVEVFARWDWDGDLDPVRAGLLLSVVAMGAGAMVAAVLAVCLWSKRG
jgi:hypothetical protein